MTIFQTVGGKAWITSTGQPCSNATEALRSALMELVSTVSRRGRQSMTVSAVSQPGRCEARLHLGRIIVAGQ